METKIDLAQLAHELAAMHERGHGRRTFVVVVPLAEGRAELVREFLAEGPPYDAGAVGLERHEVFLTESEAVFLFESEDGLRVLERILAEPELWDVASAWEHSAAGQPRVGDEVYRWPEGARPGER
jgi:hypothetical protein